jgi:hypothetical protein
MRKPVNYKYLDKRDVEDWRIRSSVYDHPSVKRILDQFIVYAVEHNGWNPNYKYENVRFLLMFGSAAIGTAAQILPGDFREHYDMLAVCVVLFAIVGGLYLLLTAYMEYNFIMIANKKDMEIRIQTVCKQYDTKFTMKIKDDKNNEVDKTFLVNDYIDGDGVLLIKKLDVLIKNTLTDFEKLSSKKKK